MSISGKCTTSKPSTIIRGEEVLTDAPARIDERTLRTWALEPGRGNAQKYEIGELPPSEQIAASTGSGGGGGGGAMAIVVPPCGRGGGGILFYDHGRRVRRPA